MNKGLKLFQPFQNSFLFGWKRNTDLMNKGLKLIIFKLPISLLIKETLT